MAQSYAYSAGTIKPTTCLHAVKIALQIQENYDRFLDDGRKLEVAVLRSQRVKNWIVPKRKAVLAFIVPYEPPMPPVSS